MWRNVAAKFRGELDVDFSIFADADIYCGYLRMRMSKIMWISNQNVDFLLFMNGDIYFQYLRMLEIMRMQISGQDVSLIFTDADIDADIYFQYLQMWMIKIMRISADVDIQSTSSKVLPQNGGIGEIPTAKSGRVHAH